MIPFFNILVVPPPPAFVSISERRLYSFSFPQHFFASVHSSAIAKFELDIKVVALLNAVFSNDWVLLSTNCRSIKSCTITTVFFNWDIKSFLFISSTSEGMARAAKAPTIANAISNSVKVNAFLPRNIYSPLVLVTLFYCIILIYIIRIKSAMLNQIVAICSYTIFTT